ncbi:PspA/IM30 family protein [Acidimicrobiaceae bacterium USS-CC1]|uniref:PspA/IM30 family protein n=1 Tax=Acidiferrimicrobium australe TaxID=2664430 RepID=A0ABW9QVL1_9ACTN|nr:PspA/IM30 family protein [Acidiferrimicrobium australe]
MWKGLKRQWKYQSAKINNKLEERADPKIQLEQAIQEAQEQHRMLVEQAANVIARQKQTELQLNRAMDDLAKTNQSTRQALVLAQQAQASGDAAKAAQYNQAAEGFANQLVAIEQRVQDLKQISLQTAQASDQAKAAVQQNSTRLQQQLAERNNLLNQLEQARMQEQLNAATSQLSQTVGGDVPSLDQVREKIESRYAKAVGTSELGNATVESRMLEVQQAVIGVQAQSKLDQIRAQMQLEAGGDTGGAGARTGATLEAGASGELPEGSPGTPDAAQPIEDAEET